MIAKLKHYTRHWPSPWKLLIAGMGSIFSGLVMLDAVGLLPDFISLFNH